MIDLSIACVIDEDIVRQVQASKPRGTRANYDCSVVQALRRVYRKVSLVSVGRDMARTIAELLELQPDVVFNLALSSHPLEASFAGLLDTLGMAYTGSGPRGIVLSNDKVRSRHLLKAAGVRVPRSVELIQGQPAHIDFPPPLIVKPASLASSVGISDDSVVKTPEEARKRAERIWRHYGTTALCEEFIVGREFRVSVIEATGSRFRKGGIIEWRFGTAAPGWGFRTEAIRINPRVQQLRQVTRDLAVLSPRIATELIGIGRIAMRTLDVRGYATLDVRMDEQERPTVLEVNSNPGLWSESKLWNVPSFESTLKQIADSALRWADR